MKRQHLGFTLVELLVVITIISILMGLLIPAVNAARESARNVECGVKVKNLALAAIQHENNKKYLPGYVDKYGVFPGGLDRSDLLNYMGSVPAHVKVGGFGVALLPWLDAQPTYEHWTDDSYPVIHDGEPTADYTNTISVGASGAGSNFHSLATPNLANFICPSNPNTDATAGRNSYIVNSGMSYFRTTTCAAANGGTDGPVSPAFYSNKNNGTSVARYLGVASAGDTPVPPVSITLDDIKDGKTYTALYSENIQALPWYLPGFMNGHTTGTNLVAQSDIASGELLVTGAYQASRFSAGMVWHFEDPNASVLNGLASPPTVPGGLEVGTDAFTLHRINGAGTDASQDIFVLQMTLANSSDLARPSSAHVDGVNMGFADGGNRFIASSIDYRVYQSLLTPRGKSSDVPWKEFVLTNEIE